MVRVAVLIRFLIKPCKRTLLTSSNLNNHNFFLNSGVQEGFIVIWYPFEPQNQKRKLEGHSFQIHQLLFSTDGRYLASTDYSKKLIVWSTKVK